MSLLSFFFNHGKRAKGTENKKKRLQDRYELSNDQKTKKTQTNNRNQKPIIKQSERERGRKRIRFIFFIFAYTHSN